MPIYDYTCAACGYKTTKLVPLSERDGTYYCPVLRSKDCDKEPMKREITAPAHTPGKWYQGKR